MAINIQTRTCDEAWRQTAALVRENGIAQESRTFRSTTVTTETLELLHAALTIEDPRQRIVFARPINPAFAITEVIWILAGSNDLAFINFWNPLMKKFSDDNYTLRGAYGYRLGMNTNSGFDYIDSDRNVYFVPSHFSFNQLHEAVTALKNVQHSRQVVLQIWDANQDFPVYGKPRSADIPCNLMSHLLVRDGKLHWLQIMRSNDLMWGTPYNFIQWTTIQEIVAGWLGLEVGQYTHIASSLHVYAEHWEELKHLNLTGKSWTEGEKFGNAITRMHAGHDILDNQADLRIEGYDNWLPVFKLVLNTTVNLMKAQYCSDVYGVIDVFEAAMNHEAGIDDTSNAYVQWIYLLAAEVCRKFGNAKDAERFAEYSGPYYQASWMQWFERKQAEARK